MLHGLFLHVFFLWLCRPWGRKDSPQMPMWLLWQHVFLACMVCKTSLVHSLPWQHNRDGHNKVSPHHPLVSAPSASSSQLLPLILTSLLLLLSIILSDPTLLQMRTLKLVLGDPTSLQVSQNKVVQRYFCLPAARLPPTGSHNQQLFGEAAVIHPGNVAKEAASALGKHWWEPQLLSYAPKGGVTLLVLNRHPRMCLRQSSQNLKTIALRFKKDQTLQGIE